jgi:hypothetical protein
MENCLNSNTDDSYALMQLLIEAIQGVAVFENVPTNGVTELYQVSSADYSAIESPAQPQEALATHDLSVLDSFLACSAGMTTVMVRNVPRKCTQRMLLNDIISQNSEYCDLLIRVLTRQTDHTIGNNIRLRVGEVLHACGGSPSSSAELVARICMLFCITIAAS